MRTGDRRERIRLKRAGSIGQGFLMLYLFPALFAALLFRSDAHAFTLNVVGCDRNNNCATPVNGFRWLLEEDNTNQKQPGIRVADSIGLDVHNSHAPVVCKGSSSVTPVSIDSSICPAFDPARPYYVSVLPDGVAPLSDYSISGSMLGAGQTNVTVRVHKQPLPTAQISVLLFNDNNPINNIPDQGEEGLPGWTVLIFDQAGQMLENAFGDPLGTTYDALGNITFLGDGTIRSCPSGNSAYDSANCSGLAAGQVLIKNLPPGKYGIRAFPPGNPDLWVQTATIEGTPGIDAWVRPNEPPTFIEGFGTGFFHVFIGFVNPSSLPWAISPPAGITGTITGRNVYNHFGRPPENQGFFPGEPVPECWVGLNDLTAVSNQGLIAVPCDDNSNFVIPNVPPGTYQLVTWDKPLDALFGFSTVIVPPGGGTVDLGKVLSFRWFGALEGSVFFDANQNGYKDPGEPGLPNMNLNIRFRDGSMYQAQSTDLSGEYGFPEIFPFFKWLVVEVDFSRYKPTGMTAIVDDGGAVDPSSPPFPDVTGWDPRAARKLRPQPQHTPPTWLFGTPRPATPIINPNTGNNLSRTETGPVLTQAMQIFLNQTNIIDWGKTDYAPGENGGISGVVYYATTRAENDPRFAVADGWEPGIPRVQVNLYRDSNSDGVIDDINGIPGIQNPDVDNYPLGWAAGGSRGQEDIDRNGDGHFDLGDALDVAWTDSWDDNKPADCNQPLPPIAGVRPCYDNYSTWNQVRPGIFDGGYAFGLAAGGAIPAGTYIVETVPPPGYEVQKEEDVNVLFGDAFVPGTLALPPVCVGNAVNTNQPQHIVPPTLQLFPGQAIPSFNAGLATPLCTMKQVTVLPGQNAAADFFLFTEVPKAARAVGFVNNDLAAEFNSASPIFGEKASPSWIPVSFRDWQGNEVARVYTDEFGSYNALLPSSFTVNAPIPTGVSPNMITAVLNHPFLPDGSIDPFYNSNYSVTPWTLDYWPGKTTYLDTPLVPVAAFAGFPVNGPDVEPDDGTPVIASVTGSAPGPIICSTPGTLTITSAGPTRVLNPDFDPAVQGSPALITRDYGFSDVRGTVSLNETVLPVVSWDNLTIVATVPEGAVTGQLLVTRADSKRTSPIGITLHVSTNNCADVIRVPADQPSIQAAVDAAPEGSIILVAPGTYNENVILYKNVSLQGSGAALTSIYANPALPADRLAGWHAKISGLGIPDNFTANEAPGIMVLGNVAGFADPPLIDGFKIFGAIAGGGIYVNTDVSGLRISNNKLTGNYGNLGGGISIGIPATPSNNPNIVISRNVITKNGGIQGGGGITIYPGSDNYSVLDNFIAGNFSRFNGGGISHNGLSNFGLIRGNWILFNEVEFGGGAFGDGAGIFIGGDQTVAGLTNGAGNVIIDRNLIQGNLAGAGSGAGIRALNVNGLDVSLNPFDQTLWYGLEIRNNIIVNNVAGYQGGGIALQDVARVNIIHNTIAFNDSTATSANAFEAGSPDSTPQAAGIVSNIHSALLAAASGQNFSDPVLLNNIIWNNRSFYTTNGGAGGLIPNPVLPVWDLSVTGTASSMNPDNCFLTTLTPADGKDYDDGTNIARDPVFVKEFANTLFSAAVIDEGGNFITIRFRPLKKTAGDYHIRPGSPAIERASVYALSPDFDMELRPNFLPDAGADELHVEFSDVSAGFWARDHINTIADRGVTSGCAYDDPETPLNEAEYCPDRVITRGQMAVLLVRSMFEFPSAAPFDAYFTDIPNDSFAPYINRLMELGITGGCGSGAYCPDGLILREQMAAFLVRAIEGEPAGSCAVSPFADVQVDSPFCKHIERLAALGLTGGCGGGNFCPSSPVTRDQIAVFLGRSFFGLP